MKVKKLYGCIDTYTGELQGAFLSSSRKYAYCRLESCKEAFEHLLKKSSKYKIIELRAIPLLTGDSGCQEQ